MSIERSMNESWDQLTGKVRAQAKHAYVRKLCLAQRVRYVSTALFATIWYTAQILPTPLACTQQLTTAIAWFIRQGVTFLVDPPETEEVEGMSAPGYNGEVPNPHVVAHVGAEPDIGNCDSNVICSLGLGGTTNKPTERG
jgi:hypothetical protein